MICELANFGADVRVQVGHLPLVNPIERDAVGAELERVLHRDAPPAGFIGGQGLTSGAHQSGHPGLRVIEGFARSVLSAR